MADNYRIKYKAGDFEIEVESSDKSFVESKLKELLQDEQTPKPDTFKKVHTRKSHSPSPSDTPTSGKSSGIDIVAVVNEINDSDKHKVIEEKILKKSNQLNRILLVFYFANKIKSGGSITTGDIEKITDQLGIRIKSANAAANIKSNSKFFASETVRKRGAVVKYKINRKGIEEIESIIA